MTKENKSSIKGADRRIFQRKILPVEKGVSAEVRFNQNNDKIILFVLDISKNGIKLLTDYFFPPEDVSFKITFILNEPFTLTGKAVWQKSLWHGMNFYGLRFSGKTSDKLKNLDRYLEGYTVEDRRTSFRLNQVLPIEMTIVGKPRRFYALTHDLSTSGMRMINDFSLPENLLIPCRISLGFEKAPLETLAEVVWKTELRKGTFAHGLKFSWIKEGDEEILKAFIEGNLSEALAEVVETGGEEED